MKQFTSIDVFDKIVGAIESYGSSERDEEVIKNLDDCAGVLFFIVDTLCDNVSIGESRDEASIVEVGNKSKAILKYVRDRCNDVFDEISDY